MNAKPKLVSIVLLLIFATGAFSQQGQSPELAPNAPRDKSIRTAAEQLDQAIKPYVELARKTYPEAKQRFLKGLPPKHTFFITTRLHDAAGRFEQVFVAVQEITEGKIKGLIWSDIETVAGFKHGDSYAFSENELIDWTISKPDGTEEGNFVGKFLDNYQAQSVVESARWRSQPATPEWTIKKFEEAATKYQAAGPYPRGILYDIGYPHNDQELAALDGYAAILITALTQERDELPFKRVYVLLDGREIDLKLIKVVLSEQSTASSISAKTFGAFRADAMYLLPVYLRLRTADLMVNFAKNKMGSKVGIFGGEVSTDVSKLTIKSPTGVGPSDKVLTEFLKREFPSFFKE
jgi:hypothetical protein